ncbi:unnamed protein product [Wuchereria bancrofti]|uniref:Uncharacterized protein n=1 Tax=Wuchereria bancrofti TaxID=6293 RepID=A0A3P7EII0_WUCBA|nr:unnamed protein product [Wuchereria bancrofti]
MFGYDGRGDKWIIEWINGQPFDKCNCEIENISVNSSSSTNGESMRASEITTYDGDNEILSYDNEYYQQNELNWLRAIINRQKAKIEELNEGRKMLFIELAQFKDIMLVDIYLVDIYSANNSYTEVLSTTY